jgi:hypothetical protein
VIKFRERILGLASIYINFNKRKKNPSMIPEFKSIGFYSHCGNDELSTFLLDIDI